MTDVNFEGKFEREEGGCLVQWDRDGAPGIGVSVEASSDDTKTVVGRYKDC